MADPRIAKLADVLVNYSARVRKGDLVKITGSSVCEPLLAEVYRGTLRAGGNPYIDLEDPVAAWRTVSARQAKDDLPHR